MTSAAAAPVVQPAADVATAGFRDWIDRVVALTGLGTGVASLLLAAGQLRHLDPVWLVIFAGSLLASSILLPVYAWSRRGTRAPATVYSTAVGIGLWTWPLAWNGPSGPQANAESLRAEGFRVLVYSIADNVRLLRRALAGGADGVCRKAEPVADTIAAIRAVHSGQQVISQEVLAAIEGDTSYVAAALGPREREVLSLYAAGLDIPHIGRTLYITENSVKEYLKRIRLKYTQVDRPAASKLDLFRRAVEDGIIPPVEPRV